MTTFKICPICSCITSFLYKDILSSTTFYSCSTLHAYYYLNLPLELGEGRIRMEDFNIYGDRKLIEREEITKSKKVPMAA